jgi:hypothetical protein
MDLPNFGNQGELNELPSHTNHPKIQLFKAVFLKSLPDKKYGKGDFNSGRLESKWKNSILRMAK